MKQLPLYIALTLSTLGFTQSAAAELNKTQLNPNSPHTVGFEIGGGQMEYKSADGKNNIIGTSYLYYNYQFADNFYAEVGFSSATDADNWQCEQDAQKEWQCTNNDKKNLNVTADTFKYSALVIALKGNIALSQRNSLYGKIGVNFYDYELELKRDNIADKDGTGMFIEAGWEYRWDNNIGLNIGIKTEGAGDVDMATTNIGISYSF